MYLVLYAEVMKRRSENYEKNDIDNDIHTHRIFIRKIDLKIY